MKCFSIWERISRGMHSFHCIVWENAAKTHQNSAVQTEKFVCVKGVNCRHKVELFKDTHGLLLVSGLLNGQPCGVALTCLSEGPIHSPHLRLTISIYWPVTPRHTHTHSWPSVVHSHSHSSIIITCTNKQLAISCTLAACVLLSSGGSLRTLNRRSLRGQSWPLIPSANPGI